MHMPTSAIDESKRSMANAAGEKSVNTSLQDILEILGRQLQMVGAGGNHLRTNRRSLAHGREGRMAADSCRISGACGQAYSSCRAISPGEQCCARLSRRQNRSWILLAVIASDASGDMNADLYRSVIQTCHRLKYGLS